MEAPVGDTPISIEQEPEKIEPTPPPAPKRPRIARYVLIGILALILLAAGFAWAGLLPPGWVQKFQTAPTTVRAWWARVPLPDAITEKIAAVLPGSKNPSTTGPTLGLATSTPANSTIPTGGSGIVTVITMTPTGVVPSNGSLSISTGQPSPIATATPPTASGLSSTEIPAVATPTAAILTPVPSVPSLVLGPSPSLEQLRADMQNLYATIQTALGAMESLRQEQLTGEELVWIQNQVNAATQQMANLTARLPAAQTGVETTPSATPETMSAGEAPSPALLQQLLGLMGQSLGMARQILEDPATDPATLANLDTVLTQLQEMMAMAQILIAQIPPAETSGFAGTLTPTITPSPTAIPTAIATATPTTTPTATPTAIPSPTVTAQFNAQWNDFRTLLSQMEQLLAQMQSMLQQMHSQTGTSPSGTPGASGTPGGTKTPTPIAGTPVSAASSASTPHSHNHTAASMPVSTPEATGQAQAMAGGMQGMMDMMACMGSSDSQASGATPIVPYGPLARTVQAGDVTISVVPLNLRTTGVANLDFYIVLDSASVELRPDLARHAVLRMPSGMELGASRWSGPQGGYHLEGTLSFPMKDATGAPVVVPSQGTLTLTVGDMAGVGAPVFSWDLSSLS